MDIKLFPLFWQSWIIVAMNIATRNIWVQVFLWTYVFNSLGYIYLGTESLGHIITLCLTLWGSAKMFSEADTPFCMLSSNGRGLQSLSSLANTCCFFVFLMVDILAEFRVLFACISSMMLGVPFHVFVDHLYIFFRKILCTSSMWVFILVRLGCKNLYTDTGFLVKLGFFAVYEFSNFLVDVHWKTKFLHERNPV